MDDSFDLVQNPYLKVEIDRHGSIIAFQTTMTEFVEMDDASSEKNWFDDFISLSDQSILLKEYDHLFEDDYSEIITLKHDVLTPDQKHLFMIFNLSLKIKGEQKSLVLVGNEYHLSNQTRFWYHPTIKKIDDVYFID